jgi:acetyl esterase/lipase
MMSMGTDSWSFLTSAQSAGGHLSVLTAFHLLEKKPSFKLAGLVLNYGVYDLTSLPLTRNFPRRLVLTPEIMARFTEAFTPGLSMEDRQDPSISPFYTDLTGLKLPPALFNCGTEDCLLEDTVMMALRWQMAGAETITKLYPGAPHGFVSFPPEKLPNAKECLDAIQEFLCQKLL